MCGRFTLRTPLPVLAEQLQFDLDAAFEQAEARYNIAPTQNLAAVRVREAGGPRELAFLHWGLIPSWAKDAKIAASTINARAETVAEKPAFRTAFKRRRCLVLADGYFEWKREGKIKQPFYYEIDDGQPFALAGLWETWRGPAGSDGPPLESCSLITTEANELASQVHDRMPVILDPVDYDLWLNPSVQNPQELSHLLAPFDAGRMTARPVSTYVSNARNQGPQCLEPAQ